MEMTRQNIFDGEYDIAIDLLSKAQVYPENLGEGKLPGAQENDIFIGCAVLTMV